jgi:hypothetical protein
MKSKEAAPIAKKTDEASRREFLVKAGKMALYVPPAMMVLMHPGRNALACGSVISKKSYTYHYHNSGSNDNWWNKKGGKQTYPKQWHRGPGKGFWR